MVILNNFKAKLTTRANIHKSNNNTHNILHISRHSQLDQSTHRIGLILTIRKNNPLTLCRSLAHTHCLHCTPKRKHIQQNKIIQ